MRHPTPTIAFAVLFCSLVFVLAACGGGGDDSSPSGGSGGSGGTGGVGGDGGTGGEGGTDKAECEEYGETPIIRSLEPNRGPGGLKVWVIGCNLGDSLQSQAYFNGTLAPVEEITNGGTRLRTRVPDSATTGRFHLLLGAEKIRVNGPQFTVVEQDRVPALTGISPSSITELRPGVNRTQEVHLSGSNFIPDSHVYMTTPDGVTRFLEEECTYSSPTAMRCTLPTEFISTPTQMKFLVKNEREGYGGGTSNTVTLYVWEHIDLLVARAVSAKQVDLVFSLPISDSSRPSLTFGPPLAFDGSQIDMMIPWIAPIPLTEAMVPNTKYTVTVGGKITSKDGGEIWNKEVSFMAFNSDPAPIDAIGEEGGGCTASTFDGPATISGTGEQIFVSELGGHQIQMLELDGTMVGFLGYDGSSSGLHDGDATAAGCPGNGSSETGAFRSPRGRVVVDPNTGDLIVADTGNARVLRFGANGEYKGLFGSDYTSPVIVTLLDGKVWVADEDDTIRVFPVSGSGSVATHGGPGTENVKFSFGIGNTETPFVPALVSDGEYVYITEPGNHRVQKLRISNMQGAGWVGVSHNGFSTEGTCCSSGTSNGEFENIRGMAIDVAGYLWVADEANGGRLQKIGRDGKFVMSFDLPFIPSGIDIDWKNVLWVSDANTNQVRRYQL